MNCATFLTALALAITPLPLFAADDNAASSSIDLSFTRIEVTVALKQYEKVRSLLRSLLMDAELDRKLQSLEPNITKEKSAAVDMRIETLDSELKKLRTFVEDALKAARHGLEREAVATARIREQANIRDLDPLNDVSLAMPEPENRADPLAYIKAKNEMSNYMAAKARYLKARHHWQKLE